VFPKGFWTKLIEAALSTPYLALLMGMSILLTVVSFYTTYDGLAGFLPHAVLAIFVSMAIQSLLFVTSWRLGFMLADKEPLAWLDVGVFAVCFVLSVFFSFSSLFNVVFSPEQQERARITRVHNGVTEAIGSVGGKARERRRGLVEDLIRSPEYHTWADNVAAVARLAADSRDILAKVFAESYERRRQKADQLARDAQDVAASKKTLARSLTDEKAALDRVQAGRGPLEEDLSKLRSNLAKAEDAIVAKQHEMDAEERGVGKTGKPNRGPVWRGLEKEQQRLIVDKDAIANRIALEGRRLDDLNAECAAIQSRIDKITEQQRGLPTRAAAAAKVVEEARREVASTGAGTAGLDLDQGVETLRAALPQFATSLDLSHFDDAAALCQRLLTDMAAIPLLEQKTKPLSCDRGPMLPLLNPINEAAASLAAVELDCLPGGDATKTVDKLPFADALTYGRTCVETANLPGSATRAERRELDRLDREESPQASPFTKTTNALLAGEKLSIFALLIALAIDLLVLFVGLIGARAVEATVEPPVAPVSPTDSPEVKLYKWVLAASHAANLRLEGTRYDHRVVLSGIADEGDRELVRQFLVGSTSKGAVRQVENKEGEFLLRYGVADKLREWVQKASVPPPPPSPARRPPPPRVESAPRPAPPPRSTEPPRTRAEHAPQTIDDLDLDFVPVGRLDRASDDQPARPEAAATESAQELASAAVASPHRPAPSDAGTSDSLDPINGLFR